MKVAIFACVLAAAATLVAGAPTPDNTNAANDRERVMFVPQPEYRARRSHFGPPPQAYASPCGAVPLPAIAPAPAYLAPHGPASYGGGGYGGGGYGGGGYGGGSYGGGHAGYGYAPHYRAEDMETDILNFSDMDQGMSEHIPMARYSYGAAPVAQGAGLASYGPAVAAGPAFGIFPNANAGGCNVPLLLSCSPSIVPGRLVKGYSGYGAVQPAAAAASYRGVEELNMEHQESAEESHQENLEPAEDSATSTH